MPILSKIAKSLSAQKMATAMLSVPAKPPIRFSSTYSRAVQPIHSFKNVEPIYRETARLPMRFIPQEYRVLHERYGKYLSTRQPGLNFFVPLIDSLVFVRKTDIVHAVTEQHAITLDSASAYADGVIFYSIGDEYKAAYGVENISKALVNLIESELRNTMGSMELKELIKSRSTISAKIIERIKDIIADWGVVVKKIEIRDIRPADELRNAMDSVNISARKREATVLEAQGYQESLKIKAEGDKTAAVLKAEASAVASEKEAEAQFKVAQFKAQSIEALAKAEATSIKVVADEAQKSPEILHYNIAKKNTDAWEKLASSSNNKLVFIPGAHNSVLNPIAYASEILQEGLLSSVKKNTPS